MKRQKEASKIKIATKGSGIQFELVGAVNDNGEVSDDGQEKKPSSTSVVSDSSSNLGIDSFA
jgi:hypothetical protein